MQKKTKKSACPGSALPLGLERDRERESGTGESGDRGILQGGAGPRFHVARYLPPHTEAAKAAAAAAAVKVA